MNWLRAMCVFSILIYGTSCVAQDITDVEAKPYGSYTGGSIDTIDLATGNLMLNIPLVSYPQRGTLPPLSFSVELNNAPYSQIIVYCDVNDNCVQPSSRFDTSPPGAVYQAPNPGEGIVDKQFNFQNAGAYLTSSFAGGIVTGQYAANGNGPEEYLYNVIDPSGTTHELESDASSWVSQSPSLSTFNTYRTPDGSGYAFVPNGNGYNPWDIGNQGQGSSSSAVNWLGTPSGVTPNVYASGVRLGTLYTPSGIQYSSTIASFSIPSADQGLYGAAQPRALTTTAKDPSNNTITRTLWYWSGYQAMDGDPFGDVQGIYANVAPPASGYPSGPYYIDSIGRIIPDVLTMQATMANISSPLTWNVPGPGGSSQQYTIWYTPVGNSVASNPTTYQVEGGQWPDPSVNLSGGGYGISLIMLPDRHTYWQFNYSGADLVSVITPAGGEIDFTYTTIGSTGNVGFGRCNSLCHAVATRTQLDGVGHSFLTTYNYGSYTTSNQLSNCPSVNGVFYAFWTTETSPEGNDTVHSFCAISPIGGTPMANEYHEIETDYYQGLAPAPAGLGTTQTAKLLKTVAISNYEVQADVVPATSTGSKGIVNVLPTQVTTTTPAGPTTELTQYSNDVSQPLFYAGRVACDYYNCNYFGQAPVLSPRTQPSQTIPISYLSPTSDKTY